MAAPTLIPGFTTLSTCDANTGWSAGVVDTEFYKQGTASLSGTLRSSGLNNVRTFTFAQTSMANTHIRLWFAYAAPGALATFANGGVRMEVVTSTGTLTWYLAGSDTYEGGWTLLTFDTSRTPDLGTGNLANSTGISFRLNLISAPRNATNTWWDFLAYGNGITFTGGTEADPVTFTDMNIADSGLGYGTFQRYNSVFYASTNLILGATANTWIEDSGQILVFENQPVNADLYKILPEGTGTTTFKLKDSVIKSASTLTRFDLLLDSANFNTLEFTGNAIINADEVRFKAGQSISGGVFSNCSMIIPSTATFTNNTIGGYLGVTGALYINNTSGKKDLSFTSSGAGHAIYIDTPGTYDFTDFTYSGYGATGTTNAVVYNNSGGLVTINVSGGDNPTYRNGTGASTVVNNTITVTLTGLRDNTEVRVYPAGVRGDEIAGIEDVIAGTFDNRSFAFSIDGGFAVDIRVYNVQYIPISIINFSATGNTTLPIVQVFDRTYFNPA